MTIAIHAPGTMRCRWYYATGCTENGFVSDQQRNAHERGAHGPAELTGCRVCGEEQWRPPTRGVHLSLKHGIRAGTRERFETDAKQIEAIWKAGHPGEPSYRDQHPDIGGQEADVIPMPPANGLTVVSNAAPEPEPEPELAGPEAEPAAEAAPEPATPELPGMPAPTVLEQIVTLVAEIQAAEDAYADHAQAQQRRAKQLAYLARHFA